MVLHTPGHGTDEAFGRRRRIGRAYLEYLRHKRRIIRNPVAHHNPTAGIRDADHLPGDIEGLWGKHGSEHGDGQIEGIVGDALEIACITLLERQSSEPLCRGPAVPRLNEIPGDIDADDI